LFLPFLTYSDCWPTAAASNTDFYCLLNSITPFPTTISLRLMIPLPIQYTVSFRYTPTYCLFSNLLQLPPGTTFYRVPTVSLHRCVHVATCSPLFYILFYHFTTVSGSLHRYRYVGGDFTCIHRFCTFPPHLHRSVLLLDSPLPAYRYRYSLIFFCSSFCSCTTDFVSTTIFYHSRSTTTFPHFAIPIHLRFLFASYTIPHTCVLFYVLRAVSLHSTPCSIYLFFYSFPDGFYLFVPTTPSTYYHSTIVLTISFHSTDTCLFIYFSVVLGVPMFILMRYHSFIHDFYPFLHSPFCSI